ncbi:MAG: hypothetical protein JSR29_01550 [Nitrospira sp.]|nr:hypothetical protein [Nitrospira sp.]
MASRYRKIDPRIWTDEKFRLLKADEQRIALYILTAQSNRIGLFSFSPGKACEDLGTLPPTFQKGFQKVCQTLHWEWDSDTRVLYLPTWWRYNQPENANNVIGNLKDLDDLPETPLLARFSTNTAYLPDGLIETFTQMFAKRYPQRSPKRSPSQEQEQEQEQEQDVPPAVDHDFEDFWKSYPARNGKRLGRAEAVQKWNRLKTEDRKQVLIAVHHYANSKLVSEGIGIKDPHRWLINGKGNEPWRDWIEPERPVVLNGHASPQSCTKRVQKGEFLKPCGAPVDPRSRPAEPRCTEHLSPVRPLQEAAPC